MGGDDASRWAVGQPAPIGMIATVQACKRASVQALPVAEAVPLAAIDRGDLPHGRRCVDERFPVLDRQLAHLPPHVLHVRREVPKTTIVHLARIRFQLLHLKRVHSRRVDCESNLRIVVERAHRVFGHVVSGFVQLQWVGVAARAAVWWG